jgi:hypothetical protein
MEARWPRGELPRSLTETAWQKTIYNKRNYSTASARIPTSYL